mmetsp:Transcript_5862/g.11623  ORF Transcript_5862/g.11623 Transcript_5862/m.11623 type:complete len:89 (-) Transcript_5862:1087-1353(-)
MVYVYTCKHACGAHARACVCDVLCCVVLCTYIPPIPTSFLLLPSGFQSTKQQQCIASLQISTEVGASSLESVDPSHVPPCMPMLAISG